MSNTVYFNGLVQSDLQTNRTDWLNAIRREAALRMEDISLPGVSDEDWRFTDITPLRKTSFRHLAPQPSTLGLDDIGSFVIPEVRTRLVFVNGVYSPELSAFDKPARGVTVTTFASADANLKTQISTHLGRYVVFEKDAFSALNTSLINDGLVIVLEKNINLSGPIHFLHIAAPAAEPISMHPRCLVLAGEGSKCSLIEDYVSIRDDVYFVNPVVEINLEAQARLRHIKLQREGLKAFHIATSAVNISHEAEYDGNTVSLGARISRNELLIKQAGEGGACALSGLMLVGGRQLADTHSTIDHAKPHGKSSQLNKCIVSGGAHAVFNGKIMVRKNAQQTDSIQSSRNLLLSDKARIDTKPQLEIFADDVKCAHGATVGQLNEDEVFYLKSRGLSEKAAQGLLIYAFAAEVIEKIPLATVKKRLVKAVMDEMHIESIEGVA